MLRVTTAALVAALALGLSACSMFRHENQPAAASGSTGFSGSSTAPVQSAQDARQKLEGMGYSNVTGLKKESNGTWEGQATFQGRQYPVEIDESGHVIQR
jgi:hypothetical protein